MSENGRKRAGKESCWEGNDREGNSRMSSNETRWRLSVPLVSRYGRSPTSWGIYDSTLGNWVRQDEINRG